jgi:hypothetical protein
MDRELSIVQAANSKKLDNLEKKSSDLKSNIAELLQEAREIREKAGIAAPEPSPEPTEPLSPNGLELLISDEDWEETVSDSEIFLKSEGFDTDNLTSISLLSPEKLKKLNAYLCRPIYDRIQWDRWDFLFGFGAGIAGGLVDVVAGTPGKFLQAKMADPDHWLGNMMENIHQYHHHTQPSAPIDYMGSNFGGGHHRGLSSGHDLLRPLSAIQQIKEGKFSGYYFEYGKKIFFESPISHRGTPYTPTSWKEAIVLYLVHMFCDFFSKMSLPIPGTSWLRECSNREIRVFAMDMYKQGINLRHLMLQTLAPLTVEIILRVYFTIRYRRTEAPDDAKKLKKSELLLLGHSISTAFNIGKIIIMNNPLLLNVPQVLFTAKQLLGYFLLEQGRNSFIAKYRRNMFEMNEELDDLEAEIAKGIPEPIKL